MALHTSGKVKIQRAVDARQPFRAGNISAQVIVRGDSFGRLPADCRAALAVELDRAADSGSQVFGVWSWGTPIGWIGPAGVWCVPDASYSKSTTNHQNVLRAAVGRVGLYGIEGRA